MNQPNIQDFLTQNVSSLSGVGNKIKMLLKKKNILSKEEYSKSSDALRKKVIDYQSQRRTSLDQLGKQRAEAKAIMKKKIEPILNTYINENNISLVIDKRNVLEVNPDNDITTIIVEKLNKELPSLNLK